MYWQKAFTDGSYILQIFEMITGEMLFNPSQEKYRYTKEDDLLGQQIEFRRSQKRQRPLSSLAHRYLCTPGTVGPFSHEFAMSGRKSYHFFNRHGVWLHKTHCRTKIKKLI